MGQVSPDLCLSLVQYATPWTQLILFKQFCVPIESWNIGFQLPVSTLYVILSSYSSKIRPLSFLTSQAPKIISLPLKPLAIGQSGDEVGFRAWRLEVEADELEADNEDADEEGDEHNGYIRLSTEGLGRFPKAVNCAEPSPSGRWLAVGLDLPCVLLVPSGTE